MLAHRPSRGLRLHRRRGFCVGYRFSEKSARPADREASAPMKERGPMRALWAASVLMRGEGAPPRNDGRLR